MKFDPSHAAARERLADFVPRAGQAYAQRRNYDLIGHPHVSGLSPYIRHRILTEDDMIRAVLDMHDPREAEKFIAEVYWRIYWKGWLELRPAVWDSYRVGVNAAWNRVQTNAGLRADWADACSGRTGIDCIDAWAQELAETGYLHNHARMWFASIWIFTLRLPWELGADFFLRHLLDGDPASNTLSWRWVGGLQTVGKTYLADPGNIARFTNGRFQPTGLATSADPLPATPLPEAGPCPAQPPLDQNAKTAVLFTHEDLSTDALPDWLADAPRLLIDLPSTTGPLVPSPMVTDFRKAILREAIGHKAIEIETENDLVRWAQAHHVTQIVHNYLPVSPAADKAAGLRNVLGQNGITLVGHLRLSDLAAWPSAKAGFFRFKKTIPKLLAAL